MKVTDFEVSMLRIPCRMGNAPTPQHRTSYPSQIRRKSFLCPKITTGILELTICTPASSWYSLVLSSIDTGQLEGHFNDGIVILSGEREVKGTLEGQPQSLLSLTLTAEPLLPQRPDTGQDNALYMV